VLSELDVDGPGEHDDEAAQLIIRKYLLPRKMTKAGSREADFVSKECFYGLMKVLHEWEPRRQPLARFWRHRSAIEKQIFSSRHVRTIRIQLGHKLDEEEEREEDEQSEQEESNEEDDKDESETDDDFDNEQEGMDMMNEYGNEQATSDPSNRPASPSPNIATVDCRPPPLSPPPHPFESEGNVKLAVVSPQSTAATAVALPADPPIKNESTSTSSSTFSCSSTPWPSSIHASVRKHVHHVHVDVAPPSTSRTGRQRKRQREQYMEPSESEDRAGNGVRTPSDQRATPDVTVQDEEKKVSHSESNTSVSVDLHTSPLPSVPFSSSVLPIASPPPLPLLPASLRGVLPAPGSTLRHPSAISASHPHWSHHINRGTGTAAATHTHAPSLILHPSILSMDRQSVARHTQVLQLMVAARDWLNNRLPPSHQLVGQKQQYEHQHDHQHDHDHQHTEAVNDREEEASSSTSSSPPPSKLRRSSRTVTQTPIHASALSSRTADSESESVRWHHHHRSSSSFVLRPISYYPVPHAVAEFGYAPIAPSRLHTHLASQHFDADWSESEASC